MQEREKTAEIYEQQKKISELETQVRKEREKTENKKDIGVIISSDDSVYNQIIDTLKLIGIEEFFLVSNWNKRTIPKKMNPRKREEFLLEVNLADHCNLNCQCCDHFSPLAKECFLYSPVFISTINKTLS